MEYKKNQELREKVISLGKDNAIELAKSIIDYFSADIKDIDYVDELLEIGMDYDKFGEPQKAIDMYLKAEKRAKAIGDQNGLGTAYSNLGVAYSNTKEYDIALRYYNIALPLIEVSKNDQELGILYNNFGFVYKSILKYKESVEYYLKSLKYLEKAEDKFSMTASYYNLSEVFAKLYEFDIALEYIDKCIEIDRELKLDSLDEDLKYKESIVYKINREKMKNTFMPKEEVENEDKKTGSKWFWRKK